MVRRFGYWRDSVIRKHNWNKKRPYYESLIRSLEPPKKKKRRANRILKNGQWVRKKMSNTTLEDELVSVGQQQMKEKILSIIQEQLTSIKEARKDTTGLGMLEHSVKMILMEIERL